MFDADPSCHIRVFDIADDGRTLHCGEIFHKAEPGAADGFRCDADGVQMMGVSGRLTVSGEPQDLLAAKTAVERTLASVQGLNH